LKFILPIARRYLIGKKSTNAIHILSGVSLLAMMIGTMALILVLSVYNGFENLVLSLYDSFRADLVIEVEKGKTFKPNSALLTQLEDFDDIDAFSLVLEENAIFDFNDKQYFARLKGIDENYTKVNPIDTCLVDGYFRIKKGSNVGVLGLGVAKALSLSLFDDFGELRVFMPKKDGKLNTTNPYNMVNIKSIWPMGLYSIEKEFDSKYVFVDLEFAQDVIESKNEVSGIEIALYENVDVEAFQKKIQQILPENLKVTNRFQIDNTLYKVMKSEKLVAYLILSFILLIAAFNIIGSLSMLVIEKRKDISILKAMGASNRQINRIFLTTGLLLSFTGAILGSIIAIIIGLLQQHFQIIKLNQSGIFLIDAFPVDFRLNDFILIGITVVLIGCLASYFPARRAAGMPLIFKD